MRAQQHALYGGLRKVLANILSANANGEPMSDVVTLDSLDPDSGNAGRYARLVSMTNMLAPCEQSNNSGYLCEIKVGRFTELIS